MSRSWQMEVSEFSPNTGSQHFHRQSITSNTSCSSISNTKDTDKVTLSQMNFTSYSFISSTEDTDLVTLSSLHSTSDYNNSYERPVRLKLEGTGTLRDVMDWTELPFRLLAFSNGASFTFRITYRTTSLPG